MERDEPIAGRQIDAQFEEITASSLIKVDQECRKLTESTFPVNAAGFAIHSCIHQVREDAGCVLHTHSRAGMAVSAQKRGLLPISQQGIFVLASLGYHDYEGPALSAEEQQRLCRALGDKDLLVLRNHGLLALAPTVPEAFLSMYVLETACRVQIDAQGASELVEIDPRIVQSVNPERRAAARAQSAQAAWPALVRQLDRLDPSYKT